MDQVQVPTPLELKHPPPKKCAPSKRKTRHKRFFGYREHCTADEIHQLKPKIVQVWESLVLLY